MSKTLIQQIADLDASPSKFGPKLKQLREELGVTASELANLMMITVPTVFRWESESGTIPASKKKALKDLLKKKVAELSSAMPDSSVSGTLEQPVSLLPTNEYFEIHSRFMRTELERAPADSPKPEVWFFHPLESLPVLRDQAVKNIWADNLHNGIHKHLVWPLAVCSEEVLRNYRAEAAAILQMLEEKGPVEGARSDKTPRGYIHFWALSAQPEDSPGNLEEAYEQLLPLNNLRIHPIIHFANHPELFPALIYDGVVMNWSVGRAYAATYLDAVRSSPTSNDSSGWLFLGGGAVGRLETIVSALKRAESQLTARMR